MKMYDKEGNEMMNMLSLRREGDNLVVKGKMMGAITTSIYVKPEDAWASLSMLSWSVIWYSPIIFIKGFWRSISKRRGGAKSRK